MPDAASIFFDGKAQASHRGSIGGLASANNFNRLKMLRHERMAGLVRLRRSKGIWDERQDRAEQVDAAARPSRTARRAAAWQLRAHRWLSAIQLAGSGQEKSSIQVP